MARSKPIPVKLSDEIIARLDRVSLSSGLNNRSAVIKFCLNAFLDHLDKTGITGLPNDWKEILRDLDGRTHRYTQQRLLAADGAESYNQQRKRRTKKNGGNA